MLITGYSFSGPFYHTKKFKIDFPCVYVLVNNQNKVVDVGQTSSVNSRIINHERKMCWIQNGCGEAGLYIYTSSDENFRILLERLIRETYNPICGQI